MSILVVKEFYNYWSTCGNCGVKMMYNSEDILSQDNDLDHIICPICGEKIYI